jgi:hypothetical protein
MALNNDLIDKVLFVQNEQKMSEIRLTSQFHKQSKNQDLQDFICIHLLKL